jgi:phycoerythrin beta chain
MKAQAAAHIQDTPSEARAGAKLRKMGTPVVEDRCSSLVAEAGSYFDRVIAALS